MEPSRTTLPPEACQGLAFTLLCAFVYWDARRTK